MLPVLLCTLENGETMITESGAMSWMTPNIEMKTSTNGGVGKTFGRLLSNESIFQNNYTAREGQGMIAFASNFPGSIMKFDINDNANIIVQKSGFLASESTVNLSLHFKPNLGVGFFGGEGIFNTIVTGPEFVILQTQPLTEIAKSIIPFIPIS